MIKTYKPSAFIPTSPRTGEAARGAIFRGENVWIRGTAPEFYCENVSPPLDLNENIPSLPLTGTISFTANSKVVSGAGTTFASELQRGQYVFAGGELLVVETVASDISLTVFRAPATGGSGVTGHRLPVIFAMDTDRGTLIRGNALRFDKGNIIAVGSGDLRINGQELDGDNLIASSAPRIALYDPVSGNYTVYQLGLGAASGYTVTNVAGGTKAMTTGKRGLRLCRARRETEGFGNPGENAVVTLGANEKARISLPAMDAASGQTAWLIFGTIFESSTSLTPGEGPWYKIKQITDTDLGGTGATTYDLEYLNSEIGRSELLSFNNDAPPDAAFVASLIGYPIYVSCQGKGTAAKPNGTSPGPWIVPAKPSNVEAAPLAYPNPVATSPNETIIGFVSGAGRIFLMTAGHLNFASFTGNPAFPLTIRPYWNRGWANPYSLILDDRDLFGSTTSGLFQSVGDAEDAVKAYEFASDMEELLRVTSPGHRLIAKDPKNEAVCVFHSAAYKNDAGFWVTVVYPYLRNKGFWNPPIVIESSTQDMIVSGVATVGDHLEFLAGGRKTGTSDIACGTYRFDSGAGPVPWYIAWSFSDDGSEQNRKIIKGFRVTGNVTGGAFGVYGAKSNQNIDVAALEAGDASNLMPGGEVAISTSTQTKIDKFEKIQVRGALIYTVRISGEWNGTGDKNRIEEVAVRVEKGGLSK